MKAPHQTNDPQNLKLSEKHLIDPSLILELTYVRPAVTYRELLIIKGLFYAFRRGFWTSNCSG